MTGSIILTEDNLSPSGVFNALTTVAPYNRLTINLRGLNLQDRKIGLKKLNLYYSWPNINNATTVQIAWRIGASYNTFNWTLPAKSNYKSATVLNQALQSFCINNGLYLKNATGDNVYFLEIESNEVSYKIDLNLFLVPTSLPVGYTAPSNFVGYPSVSVTPRFTIPSGSELSNLIGFAAQLYDGNTAAASYSSTYVPQFNPVSCIFVCCNVAKNDVPINGSTVIQAFTSRGAEYGSMIEVAPSQISYYDVDSNSNNLEITLYDQNFNQLYVQDPQLTVHLEVATN